MVFFGQLKVGGLSFLLGNIETISSQAILGHHVYLAHNGFLWAV
jgi:hypothetical protein